jgi:hypothetical protein
MTVNLLTAGFGFLLLAVRASCGVVDAPQDRAGSGPPPLIYSEPDDPVEGVLGRANSRIDSDFAKDYTAEASERGLRELDEAITTHRDDPRLHSLRVAFATEPSASGTCRAASIVHSSRSSFHHENPARWPTSSRWAFRRTGRHSPRLALTVASGSGTFRRSAARFWVSRARPRTRDVNLPVTRVPKSEPGATGAMSRACRIDYPLQWRARSGRPLNRRHVRHSLKCKALPHVG